MKSYAPLLNALRCLRDRCVFHDDVTDSLSIAHAGGALDLLGEAVRLLAESGVPHRLSVDGTAVSFEEMGTNDAWQLTLAKRNLTTALGFPCDADETVVIFLSVQAFESWASRQAALQDGFQWPRRLTIVVDGLDDVVAGPNLRCGSFDEALPDFDTGKSELVAQQVLPLVHLAPEATRRKVGQTFLTKGNLGNRSFAELLRWAERDAGQLLCSEVAHRNESLYAELKGGRRVSMPLDIPTSPPKPAEVDLVQQAASWCFTEHRDARHALLVDRLALDAKDGESFLLFLRSHLKGALQDARDQYQIVVLEKKDAAAKETREILKEVRTQADLYASKVRDLVSTFLRDLLAALLLIGLGLIGRIDSSALASISTSEPVNLFFKALALYFLLSGAFQVATHSRDLWLTTSELKRWWHLARTSLPSHEVTRLINEAIAPRRRTFITAVLVVLILNGGVALALWNWRCLLSSVLAPAS